MAGDAIADEHRVAVEAASAQLDPETVDAAAEVLRMDLLSSARAHERYDCPITLDPAAPPRHLHDELEALGANGVVCRAHESGGVAARLLHAVQADPDALAVVLWVVFGQVAIEHIPQVAIDLLFDLLELVRTGRICRLRMLVFALR